MVLQAPGGTEHLTVLEVCYERIPVKPFREPPGAEASAKELPAEPIDLTKVSDAAPENSRPLEGLSVSRLYGYSVPLMFGPSQDRSRVTP